MRLRNYEKKSMVITICLILLLFETIFLYTLYKEKDYKYENLNGIVMKDNIVVLILSKEQKKLIYKNSFFYVDDKKTDFKIVEDKNVIIRRNKNYYEVLISFKFDKKYKVNDSILISIKKEKYRLIEIFRIIWDGD